MAVLEGRHATDGARVVIKLAEAPEADVYVLRERATLQSLAALWSRSVVALLDGGEHDQKPWFAVEFVEGGSLADALARAREQHRLHPDWLGSRAHLDWALLMAHGIADALAALHGLGVVHGDLCPANVLLRKDVPILADFGESVRGTRPAAKADGDRVTAAYCAPERLRGQPLDARADMYALGAVMYELLTLEPPFPRDTTAGVLRAQREEPPVPPSLRCPALPSCHDTLVLQLLAKSPYERLARAGDVQRALAKEVGRVAPDNPPPVYAARWIGPGSLWPRLLGRSGEAPARLTVVRGQAGAGKTRVLAELAEHARSAGRLVLGPVDPSQHDITSSQAGLTPLLDQLAASIEQAPSDDMPPELSEVAGLSPKLLALLSPLAATSARTSAGRERMFEAMLALLHRYLGALRPLLLIDDVDTSDALCQSFVTWLATAQQERLEVVATSSREWPAPRSQYTRMREEVLAPLSWQETRALVRDALAVSDVPREVADPVFAETRGNPLAIERWLREAARRGELTCIGGVIGLRDRPPRRSPVAPRIAPLRTEAASVAGAAALIGRSFRAEELVELGLANDAPTRASLYSALDAMVEDGMVVERAVGQYEFVHGWPRTDLTSQLGEAQARAMHELRALALARIPKAQRSPALGRHWARAGRPHQAARALRIAARDSLRSWALEDASDLLEEALVQAQSASARRLEGRITVELGEVYAQGARHAALDALASAALEHGRLPTLHEARLCRIVATTRRIRGDYVSARALLQRGNEALSKLPTRGLAGEREWLELRLFALSLDYVERRNDATPEALRECFERARRHGTIAQRARLHQAAANAIAARQRYRHSQACVRHQRHALVLLERGRSRPVERVMARFEVAFALLTGDDVERAEAIALLDRAAADAEPLGDAVLRARIVTYQTVAARLLHQDSLTERLAGEALRLARSCGLRGYEGAAHAASAWRALRDDRRAAVRAHVATARSAWWHAERTPSRMRAEYPFQWLAHLPLLAAQAADEDYEGCRETAEELLRPQQARLPAALERSLLAVRAAREDDDVAAAAAACVRAAAEKGYL